MIVRCIIIIIIVRCTTTRQWGFLQSQRHVERSWFQVGHCIRKYKRSHRCEFPNWMFQFWRRQVCSTSNPRRPRTGNHGQRQVNVYPCPSWDSLFGHLHYLSLDLVFWWLSISFWIWTQVFRVRFRVISSHIVLILGRFCFCESPKINGTWDVFEIWI